MVDRVARALCRVHFMRKQHSGACTQKERVDFLVNEYWRNHVDDARAAITALREPTDDMAEEGFQETGDPCWPENVKKAWRAMIDAALSEPEAPSPP